MFNIQIESNFLGSKPVGSHLFGEKMSINLTVDQLIIKPPCPLRGKYVGRATSSRMWFPQQPLENKLHYTGDLVLSVADVRDTDVRRCISKIPYQFYIILHKNIV